MFELAVRDLARSGIAPEDADRACVGFTENARLLSLGFARVPALVLPYFDPISGQPMTYGDDAKAFMRVRYLEDVYDKDGKLIRYTQPRESGVHAYFAPVIDWGNVFSDPTLPICFTEGEKKALAACLCGIPMIGLGGVYNWRDDEGRLLRVIREIGWRKRMAVVCYDSDAIDNPQVRHAELALIGELQRLGADVRLARLEHNAEGKKQGVDDYIAAGRADHLMQILSTSQFVSTVELDVMTLNERVAYLEAEDCVYVLADDRRISKSAFVTGAEFSSLMTDGVRVVKGKPAPVKTQLAPLWLRHPAARRYAGTVFNPGLAEREVKSAAGLLLNRWRGLKAIEGDVTPWLDLTDHLFSKVDAEVKGLILRLLAYKAQNPATKVPLAPVLIGEQGCGKSLWAKCVGEAFAPYYNAIPSKALKSDFQPFMEASLVVVIDEAQAVHLEGARDKLKGLISEQRQELNKKHVSQAQIDTFCQFILTSNDRRVGNYDRDDRRMIVVDCAPKAEGALYDRVGSWFEHGGPAHLMHWLLNYDISGWRPPKNAPLTPEKFMAYMEGLTPVTKLAEEMLTSSYNTVQRWVDAALAWAQTMQGEQKENQRAKEIMAALGQIQIRPWYTPEELAMMFPAIVGHLHGARKVEATPAGAISSGLRNSGVPYLVNADDPRGFRWRGRLCQFLVVADRADWAQPITQSDFDRSMVNWPTYAQARALQQSGKRV